MVRRKLNRSELMDKSQWIPQEADYSNAKEIPVEFDDDGKPTRSKTFGHGDPMTRQNRKERKVYVDTRERGYTAIVNVYRLVDTPSGKPRRGKKKKVKTPPEQPSSGGGAGGIPSIGDVMSQDRTGRKPFSGVTIEENPEKQKNKAKPTQSTKQGEDYSTTKKVHEAVIKKGKLLGDNERVVLRDDKYLKPLRTVNDIRRALREYDAGKPVDIRYATSNTGSPIAFIPTEEFYADFEGKTTERRRRVGARKTTTKRAGTPQKRVTRKTGGKKITGGKKTARKTKTTGKRVTRRK